MDIPQKYKALKKKLNITDKDVARMFGYSSLQSYTSSSGKPKIMAGMVEMYEMIGDKLTGDFNLID